MNFCEQIGFLKVINIFKILFETLYIIVPLILIILIMIDIGSSIVNDPEKIDAAINKSIKRFISAIIIFFVPTIVFTVYNVAFDEKYDKGLLCFNAATKENIALLEESRKASLAKMRAEEKAKDEQILKEQAEREEQARIQAELIQQELQARMGSQDVTGGSPGGVVVPSGKRGSLTPIVGGTQRALQPGDCMEWSDNCFCPSVGRLKGFQFIMDSATGRSFGETRGGGSLISVSETCSDGSVIKVTVATELKENYAYAIKQMCLLKTTGINGVKLKAEDYHNYGTVSRRMNSGRTICSFHAYGAAIDINYAMSITVDGKSYKPYASQGKATKKTYDEFVSAIGGEGNIRNVNYVLWLYAFKPAGFTWGGNWSEGSFDPMHYEVS